MSKEFILFFVLTFMSQLVIWFQVNGQFIWPSFTRNELMLSFAKDKEITIPENIVKDMQSIYKTHAVTDSEVLQTIKEFYNKYNYLSDPHTATGLNVLNKINNNIANISLACAHPAKFKNAIFDAINQEPPITKELKNIFDKEEKMIILENNKKLVKSEILKLI